MTGIDHVTLVAGPFVLRPPTEAEAAQALTMLHDPDTVRWNPAPTVVDLSSAADWCRRGGDWSSGDHATWSILDSRGRLVGNVSLWRIDVDQRMADIGYRVTPSARNRGVATQAVQTATEWALRSLGLERVELPHAVPNQASCRVALKCGYDLAATLPQRFRDASGQRWDEHLHVRMALDSPSI